MREMKAFMEAMRAQDPGLRAEYEKLGPRYQAISQLIAARRKAKLSQSELGRRMGVTQAVVSRLESAEHSPRLDTLADAAKAMGYRIDVRFVKEPKRKVRSGRTPAAF